MLNILTRQNSPQLIRLLKASGQAYARAKLLENTISVFMFLMGFIYPVIYLFVHNDSIKNMAFGVSLGISIFSELVMAIYKSNTEKGAIIREQFDVTLFKLPWKSTIHKVSESEISALAVKFDHDVSNWYSSSISGQIPDHQMVAICQMLNAAWDISLRKKYRRVLLVGITLYTLVLITLTVVIKADMLTFFLMAFSLSSIYKHYITILRGNNGVIKKRGKLLKQIERLVMSNTYPTETELRDFQDEIFHTRQETAKVPDWFARFTKKNCSKEMDDLIAKVNTVYS